MTRTRPTGKLYQRIAADLAARIASGEFAGKQKLPTERALAERLSASRATIREALVALELNGVVETRGGSGSFIVAEPSRAAVLGSGLSLSAHPRETLDIRMILEVELAARAAEHATEAQMAEIESAIAWGWRDFRAETYRHDDLDSDPDGRFHCAVAQAAQNSAAAAVVRNLWDAMRSPLTASLEDLVQVEQYAELSLLDHERISNAIRARDPATAREAMRRHLRRYQKLIGWTS